METFKKPEMAEKQLTQIYGVIANDELKIANTRKWCVTVWLGAVAFTVSELNSNLVPEMKLILVLTPVFLFWFLESVQNAFILLHERRARQLEVVIKTSTYDSLEDDDYFFLLGYETIGYKEKLDAFIYSLLCQETVLVFYFLLAAISVLYVFSMPVT